MRIVSLFSSVVFTCTALMSQAADVSREVFGTLADGTAVEAITLKNQHGYTATIISLGASLQSLAMPDAKGIKTDIALGHGSLDEYVSTRQFMGATVGRVANRIAEGQFSLDGKSYQITTNEGLNTLHGGDAGFDQALWKVASVNNDDQFAEVVLTHLSPDGDQGFPGTLHVTARYRLTESNELQIEYQAKADQRTVVNLSNHAYWNLAGEGAPQNAMSLEMEIPADFYLPVDRELIPTGEIRPVAETVFDFRKPRSIGERVRSASDDQIGIGRGYDHNWVVTREVTDKEHLMARVTDPVSGRSFELWSNQPGLQFYSGNFMDGTSKGKAGQFYRQGDSIVLEPQTFPDAVNQSAFGEVKLNPGETYVNRMTYRFSVVGRESGNPQ